MGKRIMVTGGAGFIGSHLCRALLSEGHDVLCVDNFLTGAKRNVAPLLDHAGFSLLRHDVTWPIEAEVDEIYNLACPASPVQYQLDPVQTIRTNVLGAINVLSLADRLGVKVMQASTSEVYGDPAISPQDESYWGNVNPIGLRACYDEGKRCAETLFFDYHRQHGTQIKVVRIFNTFGPNMQPSDGRVVSNFIVQALKGEDITIYGDGRQTRSFCYIDDLVPALMRMMATPAEITGPINIGNPAEFSIGELARIVVDMVNSGSKVVYRDLPLDDPRQRRPDIGRARDLLDWQPSIPLREGLSRTIAYFESLLSEPALG